MASMVEQFNRKGSKSSVEQLDRTVEITAPIPNHYAGKSIPCQTAVSKPRSLSPEQEEQSEHNAWKENPIFTSNDVECPESDDDVPEIIKRLSQNGLPSGKPLSDTLSSDMIVNSISNGQCTVCVCVCVMVESALFSRIGVLRAATDYL